MKVALPTNGLVPWRLDALVWCPTDSPARLSQQHSSTSAFRLWGKDKSADDTAMSVYLEPAILEPGILSMRWSPLGLHLFDDVDIWQLLRRDDGHTPKNGQGTCAVPGSFNKSSLTLLRPASYYAYVRRQSLSKRLADDVRCANAHAGVSERTLDGLTGREAANKLIGPNDCYRKQVLGPGQCDDGKIGSRA